MTNTPEALKQRTKNFALRIIHLCQSLEDSWICKTMGNQLLRCGTSVGANYRATCRARSPAEFRAKMGIVLEEADEACFWLEMLTESNLVKPARLQNLHKAAS